MQICRLILMRYSMFFAGAVCGLSSLVPSQSSWSLVSSIGPSPRRGHAMAFDASRGRALCFGGTYYFQSNAYNYLGDTWEWDGANWAPQIFAAGPSARTGARMVYDSIRSRLLLIGGSTGGPGSMNDAWAWTGTTWQLVSNSVPNTGDGASACFDSFRDRVFLLPSNSSHPFEWDGVSWLPVVTSGAPPSRSSAAVAFDHARGCVVMHGGQGSGGLLDDTWEWSGSSWQYKAQLSSGPYSGRVSHAMYFDSVRQRIVMIGGYGIVPTGPYTTGLQPMAGEWEWDGIAWSYGGTAPQGIAQAGVAFDTARNVAWVFGGVDTNGTSIGSTWQRAGSGSGSPFGAGCGSPTLTLSQVLTAQPRLNAAAVARVGNIPSPVAVMAVGFSSQAYGPFQLPLALNGLGMPGCQLLHSADVFGESLAFLSPTTANYSLAIPNAPSLVGLHVYLQAFAVAPGMNPREIIASNGLDWNIGI